MLEKLTRKDIKFLGRLGRKIKKEEITKYNRIINNLSEENKNLTNQCVKDLAELTIKYGVSKYKHDKNRKYKIYLRIAINLLEEMRIRGEKDTTLNNKLLETIKIGG